MPADIKHVRPSAQDTGHDWPLIKKFRYVQPLSTEEDAVLVSMHERSQVIPKGQVMLSPGDVHRMCFIVTKGWAFRYSKLDNGNRQVINYYLPGDIISPFALFLPKANYSVSSITDLQVAVFEPDSLTGLFTAHPRLGLLYGWMLGREDVLIAEQVVRIGRRSAYKRTAHLLLEFYHRLKMVGLDSNGTFDTPLTQNLLADTLGLSMVHMNRTLRQLQRDGLIAGRLSRITLLDIDALMRITDYQPRYLEHKQQLSPVVSRQS